MKQKARVMNALEKHGAMTSAEVSAVTSLSIAKCSVYLGELVKDGLVRCQRDYTRYIAAHGGLGRFSHRWHPLFGSRA